MSDNRRAIYGFASDFSRIHAIRAKEKAAIEDAKVELRKRHKTALVRQYRAFNILLKCATDSEALKAGSTLNGR